jgi:hypothetical protein
MHNNKSLPAWIKDAMAQAEAAARDGKVPVVVLHERGQRHADDLVVLRLGDLEELLFDAWLGERRIDNAERQSPASHQRKTTTSSFSRLSLAV